MLQGKMVYDDNIYECGVIKRRMAHVDEGPDKFKL